jgi:hypothetical protein
VVLNTVFTTLLSNYFQKKMNLTKIQDFALWLRRIFTGSLHVNPTNVITVYSDLLQSNEPEYD